MYRGFDRGAQGGDQELVIKVELFDAEDRVVIEQLLSQAVLELQSYQLLEEKDANAPICFPLAHCKFMGLNQQHAGRSGCRMS